MRKGISIRLAIALATFVLARPAAAQPTTSEDARELYRKGARLYNLGQFDAALAAFERAYALSGAKPLLFNIAQAHRLAGPGHCERALRAYTGYLREEPNTSNAEEVRQRIDEMKVCAEREQKSQSSSENAVAPASTRAPAARPATTQPSAAPLARPSRSLAPIVTTVTGAALTITGGVLYWRARVKFDQVEASCPCTEGRFSGWQTVTTASYALLAVGASAFVGGAIWWALDRKEPQASRYGLALQLDGVRLFGVF